MTQRAEGEAHPPIHGHRTTLRASGEADVDMLSCWFADPDVYEWWGGKPIGRDEVLADYTGRRSPEVESFIIEAEGRAVGYLQYWRATERSGGLDMVLIPDARGRELGPDAARATTEYLFSEKHWTQITVDPLLDNDRAIRAWARAGFTADHEDVDELTSKPCLIMVIRANEQIPPSAP